MFTKRSRSENSNTGTTSRVDAEEPDHNLLSPSVSASPHKSFHDYIASLGDNVKKSELQLVVHDDDSYEQDDGCYFYCYKQDDDESEVPATVQHGAARGKFSCRPTNTTEEALYNNLSRSDATYSDDDDEANSQTFESYDDDDDFSIESEQSEVTERKRAPFGSFGAVRQHDKAPPMLVCNKDEALDSAELAVPSADSNTRSASSSPPLPTGTIPLQRVLSETSHLGSHFGHDVTEKDHRDKTMKRNKYFIKGQVLQKRKGVEKKIRIEAKVAKAKKQKEATIAQAKIDEVRRERKAELKRTAADMKAKEEEERRAASLAEAEAKRIRAEALKAAALVEAEAKRIEAETLKAAKEQREEEKRKQKQEAKAREEEERRAAALAEAEAKRVEAEALKVAKEERRAAALAEAEAKRIEAETLKAAKKQREEAERLRKAELEQSIAEKKAKEEEERRAASLAEAEAKRIKAEALKAAALVEAEAKRIEAETLKAAKEQREEEKRKQKQEAKAREEEERRAAALAEAEAKRVEAEALKVAKEERRAAALAEAEAKRIEAETLKAAKKQREEAERLRKAELEQSIAEKKAKEEEERRAAALAEAEAKRIKAEALKAAALAEAEANHIEAETLKVANEQRTEEKRKQKQEAKAREEEERRAAALAEAEAKRVEAEALKVAKEERRAATLAEAETKRIEAETRKAAKEQRKEHERKHKQALKDEARQAKIQEKERKKQAKRDKALAAAEARRQAAEAKRTAADEIKNEITASKASVHMYSVAVPDTRDDDPSDLTEKHTGGDELVVDAPPPSRKDAPSSPTSLFDSLALASVNPTAAMMLTSLIGTPFLSTANEEHDATKSEEAPVTSIPKAKLGSKDNAQSSPAADSEINSDPFSQLVSGIHVGLFGSQKDDTKNAVRYSDSQPTLQEDTEAKGTDADEEDASSPLRETNQDFVKSKTGAAKKLIKAGLMAGAFARTRPREQKKVNQTQEKQNAARKVKSQEQTKKGCDQALRSTARVPSQPHNVEITGEIESSGNKNQALPLPNIVGNKAVVYQSFNNDPENCLNIYKFMSSLELPVNSEHVLLKVQASTVSFSDCLIRQGLWWGSGEVCLPATPGVDVVGRVCSLNQNIIGKYGIATGDYVAALIRCGGNARYVKVHASSLVKVPKSVNPAAAACMVETYLSAFQSLHVGDGHSMRYGTDCFVGKKILIVGGISMVGQAMIELALLAGASTIYATARQKHHRFLEGIGASPLPIGIDEWLPVLSGQVDIVMDAYCFDHYNNTAAALKLNGKLVCVRSKPAEGEQDLIWHVDTATRAVQFNNQTIYTYDLFESWEGNLHLCKYDLAHLFEMLKNGKVKPPIADCLPLTRVPQTQRLFEARRVQGFFVCKPWLE